MKLESNHGSSNDRCCFLLFFVCFSHVCQKFCNSFFYVETMVRSECLGLVKHFLFNSNYDIDPSAIVIRHLKNMHFFC